MTAPTYYPSPTILARRPYLDAIDRSNRGLGRYELTTFFAQPDALSSFARDAAAHFPGHVDAVVGLDAMGFVVAGAVGMVMGRPVICMRKKGKIALRACPNPLHSTEGLPTPPPSATEHGAASKSGGSRGCEGGCKISTDDFLDYAAAREGTKGLEVRRDLLKPGMRVIAVVWHHAEHRDEWIDTGSQMTATCNLLERYGVVVVGLATLQLREGKALGADKLWERYDVFAANREAKVAMREGMS